MPRDFLSDNSQEPVTEVVPGRDFLYEDKPEQESLAGAAIKAPFRIGEDVIKGGYNLIKNIPEYARSARTQIPALLETIGERPGHALGQGIAGLAEQGQNAFNLPHDIINYATNRLNLIPQNINQKVQMGRMPADTQQMINQTFGQPIYPGEELARGIGRNSLNIAGGAGIAKTLNPMNLTPGGIVNNVLKAEKQQIGAHNKYYNKIWKEADKTGFNKVPYDPNLLGPEYAFIEKFYPDKSTMAIKNFMNNPLLENAQKAQSDLGNLRRKLEEKAKSGPLLDSERLLYNSLSKAEKHIEDNMFKNQSGEINKALQNKYKKVTKSYAKNVVPYKYNPAIQAYKAEESTAPELVNALSRGEFARKKGSAHPAIGIRNAFKNHPYLTGAGLGYGGLSLYNELFGNKQSEQ